MEEVGGWSPAMAYWLQSRGNRCRDVLQVHVANLGGHARRAHHHRGVPLEPEACMNEPGWVCGLV